MSLKQLLLRNSKWFSRIVKTMWITTILALIGVPLFVYLVDKNPANLFGGMPSLKEIENPKQDLSSEVISSDGVSLGRYFRFHRSRVSYDELSPYLTATLIASEDHRFYDHAGLDLPAFLRVIKGILTFSNQGGGSTLTQQTAKNLFRTREEELSGSLGRMASPLQMLIGKTKEWIIAVRLEENFTKEEIIALYLNTVPFNNNAFGIKVASETYFQKSPADLNYTESALLVGMLQGTSIFNPVRHPERALRKRNEVLDKLHANGVVRHRPYIDSLKTLPLGLSVSIPSYDEGLAPYFRSYMQRELEKWCEENGYALFESGLKIYTTIDSRMQRFAEEALAGHMASLQRQFDRDWGNRNPWVDDNGNEIMTFLPQKIKRTETYRNLVEAKASGEEISRRLNEKQAMRVFTWQGERDTTMTTTDSLRYYYRFLHAGLMSLDPASGAVKAWVGGIDHRYFKYDHVRQSTRQPGSTFKPFVYGLAMEDNFSPCALFYDDSPNLDVNGKIYHVKNSNGTYGDGKPYTLRRALAKSLNSVTMQLMDKLTPSNVAAFAQRVGINTNLDPVYSLGLGTSDVSLFDMVGAYGTFVNEGMHIKPFYITRIEDKNGNVIANFTPIERQALNKKTAYLIVHLLKGGVEEPNGGSSGISQAVKSDNEVGGKTGTTDNGSDGWFMGITPNLVTGVWVGGDERSIHFPRWGEGSGARAALPIWDRYMQKVYATPGLDYRKSTFKIPEGFDVTLDCSAFEKSDSVMVIQ